MKISIIIVNHDSLDLLDNCLGSIHENLNYVDFELLVIDNDSRSTAIEEVVKKYNRTYLIKNKGNFGFARACNQGFRIAAGEYILFLNNDTLFIDDPLSTLIKFLENKGGKAMVGCKLLNSDYSHQISINVFDNLWNLFGEVFFLNKIFKRSKLLNKYYPHFVDSSQPFEVDVIKGAFMLAPAGVIRELNGFDERFFFYSEETDLCYRFKKNGGKIYYHPGVSIIHLGGATTEKMPWFNYKNLSLAKLQFFRKNFSGPKFAAALLLHFAGIVIRIPLYLLIGIVKTDKSYFKKSYYYFKLLKVYPV